MIESKGSASNDGTVAIFDEDDSDRSDNQEFNRALTAGAEALQKGDAASSRALLEKALRYKPRNQRARNLLGLSLFKVGELERAEAVYRGLIEDHPADPTLRVNLGLVFLKTGASSDAVRCFETALDLAPDHSKAQNYLGLALAQKGELQRARTWFLRSGNSAMAERMEQALAASPLRGVAEDAEQTLEEPRPFRSVLAEEGPPHEGGPREASSTEAGPSAAPGFDPSGRWVATAPGGQTVPSEATQRANAAARARRPTEPSAGLPPPEDAPRLSFASRKPLATEEARTAPAQESAREEETSNAHEAAPQGENEPAPEPAAAHAAESPVEQGHAKTDHAPGSAEEEFLTEEPQEWATVQDGEAGDAVGAAPQHAGDDEESFHVDADFDTGPHDVVVDGVPGEAERRDEPPPTVFVEKQEEPAPAEGEGAGDAARFLDGAAAHEQDPSAHAHEPEASAHEKDAGAHEPDAGAHEPDAGAHEPDAGAHEHDAGAHEHDADAHEHDADAHEHDAAAHEHAASASPAHAGATSESDPVEASIPAVLLAPTVSAPPPATVAAGGPSALRAYTSTQRLGVPVASGGFTIGPSEALVQVRGVMLTRLDGMVASWGAVTLKPELKRFRGKATDKPFGEGPRRMLRATGEGRFVVSAEGRRFTALELGDEPAYFREEVLFAFEESLIFENGRVPSKVGSDLHLVHLRGSGRLLLVTQGTPRAVELSAGEPLRIPMHQLVGWHGPLIQPRLVPIVEDAPEMGVALELSGEGRALVDAFSGS